MIVAFSLVPVALVEGEKWVRARFGRAGGGMSRADR